MRPSILRSIFKTIMWIAVAAILIMVVAFAALFFIPDRWLQKYAGHSGSEALGRSFFIDGPIHIGWDWSTPYVQLEQVHLANKTGEKQPYMLSIDEVDFHIAIWNLLEGQLNLPDLRLVKPQLFLAKDADGSNNWTLPVFSKFNAVNKAVLPSHRANFPLIGALILQDGKMNYRDATKNLDLTLSIDNASGKDAPQGGKFRLSGQGMLQSMTFNLDVTGGSLSELRNSDADYPLDLRLEMGSTLIDAKGTYKDPVKMEAIDTRLELKGDDLADLYYLTLIPLPPSPPYALSGHLTKNGDKWSFADFKGKVGQSDLSGSLTYDTSGKRGQVKAKLNSKLLLMIDLQGFTGVKPTDTPETEPDDHEATNDNKKLLPDVPISLDRLRATDMDISLKAEKLDQPGLPLDDLDTRFNLKNGVLRVDPLSSGIADGRLIGVIVLDGNRDVPHVAIDLDLRRLGLTVC